MNQRRRTILIVDDEEDIVRPVAFRLGAEGYDTLMEPSGELGFQTALDKLPDAIIADVMMPGIDGVTLCGLLKRRPETCRIPVVMLTAKSRMGDIEDAFEADADDYVTKPFEWSELIGKLRRAIDLAERRGSPNSG